MPKKLWCVFVSLLLLTVAGSAAADDRSFSRLSAHHTAMGVSQFNYGLVPRAGGGANQAVPAPMKLANPGPVAQAAAVLVYSRSVNQEAFIGCVVRKVTPHGAMDLLDPAIGGDFPTGDETFPVPPGLPPRYAETIWAPLHPVRIGERHTRIADGLGGRAYGAVHAIEHHLAHPRLFSLPSNDVVEGQREKAIACVCDGMAARDIPPRTFRPFGIRCN